jgi:hypothetical protein
MATEAINDFVEGMFPTKEDDAQEAKEEVEEEVPATEEAEAPVQGKVQKKSMGKRQIPIPKDSASFFRARAKEPSNFTFTADGNLQVPEMRGEAAKIIELPSYRPSTSEEIAVFEARRYDQLRDVEKEYDENLKFLKEATQLWRETGASSDVMKYQRELTRLDALRTQLRSPVKWTVENKRLEIRKVLVDDPYKVKKMKFPVYNLVIRSTLFQELVQVGPLPSASTEAGAEAEGEEQKEVVQEEFIFFDKPEDLDYGALSPNTMIDFVFNSTMYTSFTQAYEVERITRLGRRKDFGPLLLKQRSPETIRKFGMKIAGDIDNPRELWIDILKTAVTQHPRYKDILTGTGKATLAYTNLGEKIVPKERRWGICLTADDPGAMDKTQWQGPNILGQAWQVVRDSLEADAAEDAAGNQVGGSFNESGKTLADAKKQRAGVLMGYHRKRF